MANDESAIGWRRVARGGEPVPSAVARRRLPWLLAAFAFGAAIVLARVIQLEVAGGAAFRAAAAQPIVRERSIPAERGRILSREGTVLACDRQAIGLNVAYRWLQNPPLPTWLRSQAKARLPRSDRNKQERIQQAEQQVREDRVQLHRQLAQLAGLTDAQWQQKLARIQQRIEEIARRVNQRHQADGGEPVIIAEELAEHWVCDIDAAAAENIRNAQPQLPGVKLIEHSRRVYPQQSLAASVVGYLGRVTAKELQANPKFSADDRIGRAGVEDSFETQLVGHPGTRVEQRDHGGNILSSTIAAVPRPGSDLQLTIDAAVQHQAEIWLDAAISGRLGTDAGGEVATDESSNSGGAVVVMDVANGELLALASTPRFDPNWFGGDDPDRVAATLRDPARPLWNRAVQMALPPGSVFKTLTAIALLENQTLQAGDAIDCRGYLHQPDQLRCEIYRRQGIGHGQVNLSDALMQSCNVFFFHFAEQSGPAPLVKWSQRVGFGQRTGVDLPSEARGNLPAASCDELHSPASNNQAEMLAIGQGKLTATPLQIARLMAAVANGGKLVTPHVVERDDPPATAIESLSPATLRTVRQGLERVVSDPRGTAHASVQIDSLSIAGKTGTAESGEGHADHAWFAGYAPADAPKIAIVVVLEHGGSGGEVAGPVARQILQAMQQRGYFGPPP